MIYDLLLSHFIPEEISKKAPKAWQVAVIAGGWFPWWGWSLILAAIMTVASFEYAIRIKRSHEASVSAPPPVSPSTPPPSTAANPAVLFSYEETTTSSSTPTSTTIKRTIAITSQQPIIPEKPKP